MAPVVRGRALETGIDLGAVGVGKFGFSSGQRFELVKRVRWCSELRCVELYPLRLFSGREPAIVGRDRIGADS